MFLGKRVLSILVASVGVMFILGGCNSGQKGGSGSAPVATVEQGKVADAVKELEKEGKYPALDRSDTLLGVDNNKNGIRDDIEKYIESIPNTTDDQRSALKQNAYAFNYVLSSDLDVTKEETINNFFHMYDKSARCLMKYHGDNYSKYDDAIEAYTFNTKKRLEVYLKLNESASGMGFQSAEGDCDERFFKK